MSLSHSFDHYCGGQSLNDQSGRECVSIDVIVRPPEIIAHKDERIPFLPASAVAGQQVFEVVVLLLLIKLQKHQIF